MSTNETPRRASGRQFLTEGAFFSFVQILSSVRGVLTFPLITKFLGPAGYGIMTPILTTVSLVTPIALLGVAGAMRRLLASQDDIPQRRNNFWAGFLFVFVNGLLLMVIGLLISPSLVAWFIKVPGTLPLLWLGFLLIPLGAASRVLFTYFITFNQFHLYALLSLLLNIVDVGLLIFLLIAGWGVSGVLVASVIASATLSLVAIVIIMREIGVCVPRFDFIPQYLALGIPMSLAKYGYRFIDSTQIYLVGYFLDAEAVGVYSAGYKLAMVVAPVSALIYGPLLPLLSRLWDRGDREEYERVLNRSLRSLFLMLVPAAFGISILGQKILITLTTAEFAGGWLIIPIIAAGVVFFQSLGVADYALVVMKRYRIVTITTFCCGALSLLLGLFLVPTWGLLGAAFGILGAYLAYTVALLWAVNRYIRLSMPWNAIIKSLIASSVMSLVLLCFDWNGILGLAIAIVTGVAVYVSTILAIGGLSLAELRAVLRR